MNHIYQTRSFILRNYPLGEYNKRLVLLTEDFGVIKMNAQAVRKIESKLRPSIQDFSFSEIVMVAGKQGWKLTNARIIKNLFHSLEPEKFEVLAKIFTLIFRLIPEEEKHPEIFAIIIDALDFLEKNPVEKDALDFTETVSVLKIMHELGYVGDNPDLKKYFDSKLDYDLIKDFHKDHQKCVEIINLAINESHL